MTQRRCQFAQGFLAGDLCLLLLPAGGRGCPNVALFRSEGAAFARFVNDSRGNGRVVPEANGALQVGVHSETDNHAAVNAGRQHQGAREA